MTKSRIPLFGMAAIATFAALEYVRARARSHPRVAPYQPNVSTAQAPQQFMDGMFGVIPVSGGGVDRLSYGEKVSFT